MRVDAAFVLAGAALACLGCGSSNDDDADSTERDGTIVVSEVLSGATVESYELSASWLPSLDDSGCSLTTLGACIVVSSCAGGASTNSPSLDAGALTFTSSSGSSATLTQASYASQSDGSFFAPGDAVTVSGAGGTDLPQFAAISVLAPTLTTLLAPSCIAGVCPTFDRTQDLQLAWSGAGTGVLEVSLGGALQSSIASCSFDLSAGSGAVPAAALAALSSGAAITLTVQASNSAQFTLDGSQTAFVVAETIAAGTSLPASP